MRLLRTTAGFSLIELIVTMAIVAILAAVALPALQSFFVSSRAQTQTADFVEALNYSRSEAVRRAVNVTMQANTGTNWHSGWTVAVAGGGASLRVHPAFTGDGQLTSTQSQITFNNLGQLTSSSSLTFRYCFASGHDDQERFVIVSHIGHIRTGREACP